MLVRKSIIAVFAVFSAVLMSSPPVQAYERHGRHQDRHYGRHHERHHRHYERGHHDRFTPAVIYSGRFVTVIVGGHQYYYSNGCYYRRVGNYYMETNLPNEVLISSSHEKLDNSGKTFIVNVPNSRGGYTRVVLKGTKDGYVGPQGEFYAEFPDVEQLKIMYAKSQLSGYKLNIVNWL